MKFYQFTEGIALAVQQIEINSKELNKALLNQSNVLFTGLRKTIEDEAKFFVGKFKIRKLGGPTTTPTRLRARSGDLRRSFFHKVSGNDLGNLRVLLGSLLRGKPLKYAKVHEEGGIIKGKPNLAIPMGDALTPAGVPRFTSPRNAGELSWIPRKNLKSPSPYTKGIFIKKKKGKAEPMFAIVSQVTIPARLGFRKDIKNILIPNLIKAMIKKAKLITRK